MDANVARGFEIVPLGQVSRADVLGVLNQSLGPGHDEPWFTWKHLNNPFGPSLGWAAVGAEGVLGVRLFMRWQLQLGERVVSVVRPVDTATAPQARRQGIFGGLTQFAVAAVSEDPEIAFIFNTPNGNSRAGYSRMGWCLLPPLTHGVWPVWPGRSAKLETDEAVFAAFEHVNVGSDRLCTPRRAALMRWRYGGLSSMSYGIARLQQAEAPNGIIYRVGARWGIRFLVVHELAGTPEERRSLLCSVARREGAWAVMAATGSGALNLIHGCQLRRGHSVVAVRPLADLSTDVTKLESWALTLGDLERIM